MGRQAPLIIVIRPLRWIQTLAPRFKSALEPTSVLESFAGECAKVFLVKRAKG